MAIVYIVLDLWSPLEPSNNAVDGLTPRGVQELEEIVQHANVLLQRLQLRPLESLGHRAGPSICLELLSQARRLTNLLRDKSTRFLLQPLEAAKPTCLFGESHDLVALLAILVPPLVEEDAERAVAVLVL